MNELGGVKVHCAWCAHERGEREFPPGISHGICPRHEAEFKAEIAQLCPEGGVKVRTSNIQHPTSNAEER